MDKTEEIVVDGKLSIDEYKSYGCYTSRKQFLIITLLVTVLMGIAYFLKYKILYLSIIMVLVTFAVTYLLGMFMLKRVLAREFKSGQFYENEFSCIFNKSGITVKAEAGEVQHKWSSIRSVHECKGILLLYLSRNMAIVIPRRLFEFDEHRVLAKKIISDNVKPEILKWK